MTKRTFRRTQTYCPGTGVRSTVKEWIWTRSGGLKVVYEDGLITKSDWKSLPEFLLAVKEQRECAVIEV